MFGFGFLFGFTEVSYILGDKKIASIGPMTSETIRRLGMKVDYEAEKYTADGLLDVIFK